MSKRSSTTVAKRKDIISEQEWCSYQDQVSLTQSDLNSLVSNFLFNEGFHSVCQAFEQEANCTSLLPIQFITARAQVKQLILNGEIEQAISELNEFNSDILEANSGLLFQLQLQHCI